ncbi:MAG: hypothetical protein K0M40_16950 [Prolixibacteraceae bacterium]|nr:hypothetical protein [Prolixibacteraceae bacterium]
MMNNNEQEPDRLSRFYERYADFTDSQIKEILKNHRNYQEPAVGAAVKIAIERQLIHSEQDLLGPEYQSAPSGGLSLFPDITNAYQYKKVVASIFRILFFMSLIPIIFAILQYSEGQLDMTYVGAGLGIVWAFLTFLLLKTEKKLIANIQILLLIFSLFGIGYQLLIKETVQFTDLLILVCTTLLALYFLLYLKHLFRSKPSQL